MKWIGTRCRLGKTLEFEKPWELTVLIQKFNLQMFFFLKNGNNINRSDFRPQILVAKNQNFFLVTRFWRECKLNVLHFFSEFYEISLTRFLTIKQEIQSSLKSTFSQLTTRKNVRNICWKMSHFFYSSKGFLIKVDIGWIIKYCLKQISSR